MGKSMKTAMVFMVLITLSLNCPYNIRQYYNYEKKEPIVISEKVGESVDAEEREQYTLFPGIEKFIAATFRGLMNGGFEIEIVTEDEKLVAVNRDSLAIELLRDYLNRFNEIQESKASYEKKWGIVDYDTLGLPITQREINRVNMGYFAGNFATGCCLVGFVPMTLLALRVGGFDYWTFQMDSPVLSYLTLIGGLALSVTLGYYRGKKVDQEQTLKRIKKAREPRVVE